MEETSALAPALAPAQVNPGFDFEKMAEFLKVSQSNLEFEIVKSNKAKQIELAKIKAEAEEKQAAREHEVKLAQIKSKRESE